jgi:integrase
VRDETQQTPAAGVVRALPTAPNRERLTLAELADAYMAAYAGRDPGRLGLIALWVRHLGAKRVVDVSADDVSDVLEYLAATPATKYVGKDPHGQPILRTFGRRAPATINRMRSVVSALFTFAQKRRLTPRGWGNPCREVATVPGNNERTRFLTSDERERLLRVARASHWPRLYLLVLTAITTGARRGELLGLRYADLDLGAGTAHVRQSKNGGQRVLPLLPAVVAEIQRFGKAAPEALVFGSVRRPGKPMVVDNLFTNAVRTARIEDFHFHDLRHSCASYLAQNGATLLEIADVLGHRTLDMVRRYAHLTVQHKAALVNRVLGGIG